PAGSTKTKAEAGRQQILFSCSISNSQIFFLILLQKRKNRNCFVYNKNSCLIAEKQDALQSVIQSDKATS
ncbi:MAG: hypothetical protein J6P76_01240, partial [Acidaminococcaceae bacterium]|nr:hypothetical protein [Acidaminococcaceae bacterium]